MAESPSEHAAAVPEEHSSIPAAADISEPTAAIPTEEVLEAAEEPTPAQQRQSAALEAAAAAAAAAALGATATSQTNGKSCILDVASDDAFPMLGKAPAKAAAAPVRWGASAGPIHVPAPVHSGAVASKWTPTIGVTAQQTIYTLQKEDKRPLTDAKRSEVAREVARKTNTKIEAASNKERGSTTFLIRGGSLADRERAKRELTKELTVRVTRTVSVPAVTRPFIIGKGGSKIQELQLKTLTSIRVPQADATYADPSEYEDDAMIDVTIEGDSDGCAQAAELITKLVKERVIRITRTIPPTPGKFYPFLQGVDQANIQEWEKLVDKVIIPDFYSTTSPPPNFSEPSGPIQVIGEKSAVEEVVVDIKERISALKAAEHAIRGTDVAAFHTQLFTKNNAQIIKEVFREHGCAIVIPPPHINRVYFVGPPSQQAHALNAALQKIEEFKLVVLDLCKAFANTPNGAKAHAIDVVRHARHTAAVKKIEEKCDVEITYPPTDFLYDLKKPCLITIIGKTKATVDVAEACVKEVFGGYTPNRVSHLQVEPLYFKHITGKDGKGAKKITASTSVEILFPEDLEDDEIALFYEGPSKDAGEIAEALEKAKEEINEIVKAQAEIVKKVLDVTKELHDKIRGERGTIINALKPSSVFIQFGAPRARAGRPAPPSDPKVDNSITLRGLPAHVASAAANITQFLKDTEDVATPNTVTERFDYPKQYSGNLIGTKGANINKLRDDFGVEINLKDGIGEIRGVKVCVDAARRKLNAQIKELDDKAVIPIRIPQQFHSIIIGSEGTTVRRLEERYNVRINFPKAARPDEDGPRQAADEIVIRGGKKGAEEARQEIMDLWKYEAENSFSATIPVLARAIGYMFKNSSKDIKHLRDESAARISIPQEDHSADPESTVEIKIRGTKSDVDHAKAVLTKIVKNAENTTARTITIDKKYHRSLIGPSGHTLRDIVVAAGGPDDRTALARLVRFPSQDSESNDITIQGPTAVVDKIIDAIQKIVAEKKNQITETLPVAPEKHRKLIGREGITRRELEAKFHVIIDIPRQRPGQPQTNPDIKITGAPAAVEAAKVQIMEMVKEPEGETIEVPCRLHHAIAEGTFFKHLQREYKVTVDHNGLPRPPKPEEVRPSPKNLPSITDEISEDHVFWEVVERPVVPDDGETYPWVLRGKPEGIAKAKAEIEEALKKADQPSFTGFLMLPDPTKYRLVVGSGGSTVERIRRETGCKITVPRNQVGAGGGDAITLHGDREGLEMAKAAILKVVQESGGEGGKWE